MTEKQLQKRLAPWRPLHTGQRVTARTYHRGQVGTVTERLDTRVDGFGRYGVKLDESPNTTTDYVRHELKPVRRGHRLVCSVIGSWSAPLVEELENLL